MTDRVAVNQDNEVVLQSHGIERYWRHSVTGCDPYLSLYESARKKTNSTTNFAKQNRFFTLYQMVGRVLTQGLPGNIVECGCWRGHSTYLISALLKEASWNGTFYVFDSFEDGLSDKVAEDRFALGNTDSERTAWQKRKFASDFNDVAASLKEFPFVSLHKGWIPDSFHQASCLAEHSFSLVHLDVDLYEPTRDSLLFFSRKMTKGGIIVVDDYGSSNFPGAKVAVDEHIVLCPPSFFIESHLMGAVIVY